MSIDHNFSSAIGGNKSVETSDRNVSFFHNDNLYSMEDLLKILQHQMFSNTSCDTPPDLLPDSFLNLFLAVYLAIIVIALLGNGLVILVIVFDRKMRTVTNVLLVSLAASDILIAGLNMPFQLKFLVTNEWTMGEGLCKFTNYMQGVLVVASIFTLTGIAIDRYYAICRPLQARHLHTTGRAFLLMGCFWLIAGVLLVPQLFIQRLEPFLIIEPQNMSMYSLHMCVEFFPDHRLNIAYTFFFYVVLYVFPVLVMFITYGRIGVTLWYRSPLIEASAGIRADANRRIAEKKRVIRMLVVIVAVFTISWFPFFTAQVYLVLDGTECRRHFSFRVTVAVLQLLAYSNSCINPVVYCLLNDSFKQSLRRALASICAKRRLRRLTLSGRRATLTDTMRTTAGLFSSSNRRGSYPNGAFTRQPSSPHLRPDLVEENDREREALAPKNWAMTVATGDQNGRCCCDNEKTAVALKRCEINERPLNGLFLNEVDGLGSSSQKDLNLDEDIGEDDRACHSSVALLNQDVSDYEINNATIPQRNDLTDGVLTPSAELIDDRYKSQPDCLFKEKVPTASSSSVSAEDPGVSHICEGSIEGSSVKDDRFSKDSLTDSAMSSEVNPLVRNDDFRKFKETNYAEIQQEFLNLDQILEQLLIEAGIYQ